MRIRDPKTTALIFESGKVVVTGARNERLVSCLRSIHTRSFDHVAPSVSQAKVAAKKHAKIVKKLGFKVKFKEFKVQPSRH